MTTPDFALQSVASEVRGSERVGPESKHWLRYLSSRKGQMTGDAAAIFIGVYLACHWTSAHAGAAAQAWKFAVAGIAGAAASLSVFRGLGVYNPDSSPLKIATTQRLLQGVSCLWVIAFLACVLVNAELIYVAAPAGIFAALLVAAQRGLRSAALRMACKGSGVAREPLATRDVSHSRAAQPPRYICRPSHSSATGLHGRDRGAPVLPNAIALRRDGIPRLTGDRRTAAAIMNQRRRTVYRPAVLLADQQRAASNLRPRPAAAARDVLRRGIDILGASIMLLTLAPLLAMAAALVKLDSRGPIFFRHARVGKDGRHFQLWKFRSMRVGAHPYQRSPGSERDPRLTRIGRILRRTSIDELPQLLNVLRGDMRLVGPRPEMPFIASRHSVLVRRRIQVKPGMTGLWQISPARAFPIHENIEYDLFYADHQSFSLDCAILLRTLSALVRGAGAA